MKKLSKYTSPAFVRFEKDLSAIYTSTVVPNENNGGYADYNGGGSIKDGQISTERPGGSATNKSTGIQDYNPFGE